MSLPVPLIDQQHLPDSEGLISNFVREKIPIFGRVIFKSTSIERVQIVKIFIMAHFLQ